MPRYKLVLEYDGAPFVGWQVQDNGVSVQGVLTAAIAAFCGETVETACLYTKCVLRSYSSRIVKASNPLTIPRS